MPYKYKNNNDDWERWQSAYTDDYRWGHYFYGSSDVLGLVYKDLFWEDIKKRYEKHNI